MKACKIILIIIFVLKDIIAVGKALFICDDDQLQRVLGCLFGIPVKWLLLWGAGLLDLNC